MTQETRFFHEINTFLIEHFDRLSPLEIKIIHYLKNEENPLDIINGQKTHINISQIKLLQVLQSLIGRSLVIEKDGYLTISPIIKEYLNQSDQSP